MKRLPPVILASQSERRRLLLRQCIPSFDCVSPEVEECSHRHLTPAEVAQANASRKALHVARQHPESLVIGSDTVVALGSRLFGKPNDLMQALKFVKLLSGKTHDVITAVCLVTLKPRKIRLFAVMTHVGFQPLKDTQWREYLSLINPLDKAGAYAIQDHGERIIGEIFGSYTNVVGLPLERLREELAAWSHR